LCVDWPAGHRGGRPHAHAADRRCGDRPGCGRPRRTVSYPAARYRGVEDGHRDAVPNHGRAALRVDRAGRELYGSLGTIRSHSHKERTRRTIMRTWQWHSVRRVVMTLVLLGITALPARGEVASDGPNVGQWQTWVLVSGTDIPVPAPPADTSDQTKTELAE